MYWKVSKISAPTLWRSHEVSTWVWIWKKCLAVQHFLFVSPSYHFFAHKLTLSSPSLSLSFSYKIAHTLPRTRTHSLTHTHALKFISLFFSNRWRYLSQCYAFEIVEIVFLGGFLPCMKECVCVCVCVCVHACMREKERGRRSHSGVHVNASERSPDWRHQFQLTIPYWLE